MAKIRLKRKRKNQLKNNWHHLDNVLKKFKSCLIAGFFCIQFFILLPFP